MKNHDKKIIKSKEEIYEIKQKVKKYNNNDEILSTFLKFSHGKENLAIKKSEQSQLEINKSIGAKSTLAAKKYVYLKSLNNQNESRSLSKNKENIYSNILLEKKTYSPNKIVSKYSSKTKGCNTMEEFINKNTNAKLKLISPLNKRRRNEKNIEFPIYSSRRDNHKNINCNNYSLNKIANNIETDEFSDDRESKTLKQRLIESQSKKFTLPNQNTTENLLCANNLNIKNLSTEFIDYNNKNEDENQEYKDGYSLSMNNLNKLIKNTINSPKDTPLISNYSNIQKKTSSKRPFSQIAKNEIKKESSIKIPIIEINKIKKGRPQSLIPNKNKIISYREKEEKNYSAKLSKKNSVENLNIKNNLSSKNFKKTDILSKISKFDERKITKLAKLIEKFEHSDTEDDACLPSKLIKQQLNSKNKKSLNLKEKALICHNKYNINYIQTETVNFGNINISLNNTNLDKPIINTSNLNKDLINNIKSIFLNKNKEINEEEELNLILKTDKKEKLFDIYSNFKEKADLTHISNFSVISFVIVSTWGNNEKVGLTEIQIFDKKGKKINIIECHVFNGNEEGINKISNNKFHLIEESEMWVSKLNKDLKIEIYFEAIYDVESIIIWNFNGKDLSKGVKEVQIYKKNNFVWKGIINKGSYNIRVNYSTTIYLNSLPLDKYNFEISDTKNEKLNLRKSNTNNYYLNHGINEDPKVKVSKENTLENKVEYPINANEFIDESKYQPIQNNPMRKSKESLNNDIELKDMILNQNIIKNRRNHKKNISKHNSLNYYTSDDIPKRSKSISPNTPCKSVTLILTSNWGDSNFIGLSQIQFLDYNLKKISESEILSYFTFPNSYADGNEFENLFDGNYETNDELYMWQTEFTPGSYPYIEIEFNKPQCISGIKIWNYNKKDELDKGVKSFEIKYDDLQLNKDKNIYLVRRAIGISNFDYSQTIYFSNDNHNFREEDINIFQNFTPASLVFKQDYDTPFLPTGFVFKLICLSNYGHLNYIGLEGIELYDHFGLNVMKNNFVKILKFPDENDLSIDKKYQLQKSNLYTKSFCISKNGRVSFFSPFIDHTNIEKKDANYNTIFLIFNRPITISHVIFNNYSEIMEIGVKEYILLCDNDIIYKGVLRKYDKNNEITSVFFTSDKNVIRGLEDKIYCHLFNKNDYVLKEKDNMYQLILKENNL